MMDNNKSEVAAVFDPHQCTVMVAPASMRVHVKMEPEYHSDVYAMRVTVGTTELLVADRDGKLNWIHSDNVEVLKPEPVSEHAAELPSDHTSQLSSGDGLFGNDVSKDI